MTIAGFDINTYKSKFLGGARAYLFFIRLNFPGYTNVIQSTIQGGLANGLTGNLGIDELKIIGEGAAVGAAQSAVDVAYLGKKTENFSYYVRATTLPESNINETVSHWGGQVYKFGATTTFSDWTVTMNVDSNADVLVKFNDWMTMVHNPQTNTYGRPVNYMVDQEALLLGGDGNPIAVYRLYSAWPKILNAVSLDYATNDVATVDVTFSYQYHTVDRKSIGQTEVEIKKGIRSIISGL